MATKPPVEVPQGAIRLNTDSQKLEFFAQEQWWEMATNQESMTTSARGVFAGGWSPRLNIIDYISINTTGNAIDFGDLTGARIGTTGTASYTRGVYAMGTIPGPGVQNTIDYITIATAGNATDFGDATRTGGEAGCYGSATRGIWAGAGPGDGTNVIDYVTIASTGNATDFGDLTLKGLGGTGVNSPTRGVLFGRRNDTPASGTEHNRIDYVTIPSTGNAVDFGDSQTARCRSQSMCNSTRGVFSGGDGPSGSLSSIDFITIATTGNSQDFGEQQFGAGGQGFNGVSSAIRGVYGVTWNNPSAYNVLEFITIAQKGNGTDFGDLTVSGEGQAGCSNAHGGLQ